MARQVRTNRDCEQPRLGSLPPLYRFFLNPYTNIRFTSSCPSCCGKTKQRKLPLAIHVGDWGMVILNKTCRYCPACELLICHQDELEEQFARLFAEREPQVIGSEYFVVGTLERKDWRRGLGRTARQFGHRRGASRLQGSCAIRTRSSLGIHWAQRRIEIRDSQLSAA